MVRHQPRLIGEDVSELLFGKKPLELAGLVSPNHQLENQALETSETCEQEVESIAIHVIGRGRLFAVIDRDDAGLSGGPVASEA